MTETLATAEGGSMSETLEQIMQLIDSYASAVAGAQSTGLCPQSVIDDRRHCIIKALETNLYAAPVVKEGWQMVPKSQYAELIQCCEDMATGKGGWAWEDILDEHRAILTAPEYGK